MQWCTSLSGDKEAVFSRWHKSKYRILSLRNEPSVSQIRMIGLLGKSEIGTHVEGKSWTKLRHIPSICLEGRRKTTKTASKDSCSVGRDFSPWPLEYNAGDRTIRYQISCSKVKAIHIQELCCSLLPLNWYYILLCHCGCNKLQVIGLLCKAVAPLLHLAVYQVKLSLVKKKR
jgi:hypothetical protein